MSRASRPFVASALALALFAPVASAQEAKASKRPDIYDPKADTRAQLDAALKKARHDQTRVLVMFGGNWCGWCHKLHDLFRSDREIAALLFNEYQLVLVDTEAPGADELLARCKKPLAKDGEAVPVGYPFLAVLDESGAVVKAQPTDELEEGDHHDPAKVRAFLSEFQVAMPDAREVVKAAVARAASEDKRVFLHFGAPWCGWCHRLEDFLAREDVAPVFARDFLDVKVDVDRMPHGQEVLAEYCKKPGGIPWMVILDAQGQPVVNSDGPKGNVGYPVEPHEIEHFLAMLNQSRRQIEPEQVAAIEEVLKAEARRIKGERR
jgi:uncharacterized protein YyaL (SSP411 family)